MSGCGQWDSLLTGVDNGEVDGGVDGVHGEDNDHLCSILVTCGKSSIWGDGEDDGGVELVPYLNSLVATDELKKTDDMLLSPEFAVKYPDFLSSS